MIASMRLLFIRAKRSDRFVSPESSLPSLPGEKSRENSKLLGLANIVLIISTAGAIFFLILLSKENNKCRTERAELRSQLLQFSDSLSGPSACQVGDIVPAFETVNLEGRQAQIVLDHSSKYLLYIFSSQCDVCTNEFSKWNILAEYAKSKNYKPLGVTRYSTQNSIQTIKSDLENLNRNFDIIMMPSMATQRAYRVVAIPEVLLISIEGRIDWVNYGALTKEKVTELLSKMESN